MFEMTGLIMITGISAMAEMIWLTAMIGMIRKAGIISINGMSRMSNKGEWGYLVVRDNWVSWNWWLRT